MTIEQQQYVEDTFRKRLNRVHNLKPTTQRARQLEVEFFVGAMTALQALSPNHERLSKEVPTFWTISLMAGCSITNSKPHEP